MNEKRGQVTIFVILAVLVVFIILLFFFLQNKQNTSPNITNEVQSINDFVLNCLKETGENGLVRFGEQGGYFIITDNIRSIEGNIPYYVYDKKNLILSKEQVSQQLSAFVTQEINFCILNFKDFKPDFEVEHELNGVNTEILDNKVVFSLDYPISIKKADNTYTLNEFKSEISVRLGTIYAVSEEVVNEQLEHPESICLSCLYDLGRKNKVHIDMLDYGNSTIFKIIDDNSKIGNESYRWSFAVK